MTKDNKPQIIFHCDNYDLKHYEIDNAGYLRFVAPISKTGNLRYWDHETKTYYDEYVPEETLINSLDSFKTKAITSPHPPSKLNPANTKDYARGMSGYTGFFDGSFLWLTGTIYDKEVIQNIQNGSISEISPGYDGHVLIAPDKKVQIKRDGNHLSVVPKGRNGRNVRFRLDSEDSQSNLLTYFMEPLDTQPEIPSKLKDKVFMDQSDPKYFIIDRKKSSKQDTKGKTPMIIYFDGQNYEVEGNGASLLATAIKTHYDQAVETKTKFDETAKKLKQTESDLRTSQTELGTIKGKLVTVENKLDEAQKSNSTDDQIERVETLVAIKERLSEIQPSFKMDSEVYGMSLPELHQLFVLSCYKADNNTEKYDQFSKLDLSSAKDQGLLQGTFLHLIESRKDSSNSNSETQNNSNAVLRFITKQDSEGTNFSQGSSTNNYREQLAKSMETTSKK